MNVMTPASRSTDPSTSHEAEAHINASGDRGAQQKLVAMAVEMYPGLTSMELSRRARMDRHAVARRLKECEFAKQVKRGEKRRCSISSLNALTWLPYKAVEQLNLFDPRITP